MSRNNEATDPSFALALNPFNNEATVNLVVGELNAEADPDTRFLSNLARGMISASPADARGYSILGAVEERQGNSAAAQSLYDVALTHSKSELHALLRTAEVRLAAGNVAGALESIDLLLRRWPNYLQQVQPILQAMAAEPGNAVLLTSKLNELPPWRARVVTALAKEPAALGVMRSLVATAPEQMKASPTWLAERDAVVAALVAREAYAEAYGLFLSAMTEAEEAVSGYVFDGGFTLPFGRTYFGWRVQKPGATEVRSGMQPDTGQSGLRIRFLDSPVRTGIVYQSVVLPLGRYQLSVDVSARNLSAPKKLFWTVRCAEGATLTTLDVPAGTVSGVQLLSELEVPAAGCARQILSLDTHVRTESWRDRYQGEVQFHNLAITRL